MDKIFEINCSFKWHTKEKVQFLFFTSFQLPLAKSSFWAKFSGLSTHDLLLPPGIKELIEFYYYSPMCSG